MVEKVKHRQWPPQYSLKRNKRARRVNLSIHPYHGLRVSVPEHYDINHLPNILNEKRAWIEKHLAELTRQYGSFDPKALPTTLKLQAIDEVWQIHYTQADTRTRLLILPNHTLGIYGHISIAKIKPLVQKWLLQKAKLHFHPWLKSISQQTQLDYQELQIRGQKGRWGSCSHEKAISLNYKLLFLPRVLVHHVMIHELCHTVFLDHSERFWRLVARFDDNWQENAAKARGGNHYLPHWIEIPAELLA